MAASVTVAEHCSAIAEGKYCDQCSAGDHNACRRVMTRERASLQGTPCLQSFPCLQSLPRTNIGCNGYCADRRPLLQMLSDGVGLGVGSVGFDTGLVDR